MEFKVCYVEIGPSLWNMMRLGDGMLLQSPSDMFYDLNG